MIDSPPMLRRLLAVAVLVLAAGLSARADDPEAPELVPGRHIPKTVEAQAKTPEKSSETPWIARWMLRPRPRGIFIRLPIMDTDPNRGITGGVMPIWVLQGATDDRIEQIHAPSLTYNRNFKLIPTYRYYYYPQEDASLVARASVSKYEREAMGEYIDGSVGGTPYDILVRVQFNVDAGQRFYGFGPDSKKGAEANYKEDYWQYRWGIGTPVVKDSKWRVGISEHYQAGRFLDGPLDNLTRFSSAYPGQYSDLRQQTNETRATLLFDSRDHAVTTGKGHYFETYAEGSKKGFLSMYDYTRYGADYRWFKPWPNDKGKVFAVQTKYEQLLGRTPPFWLLPRLGGKYSLRAYGDGRYIDRGMAIVNVEQRIKFFEERMGGVTTEFQLAPFAGLGTVFDNPGAASAKFVRPVVGAGVRAVAKPQVVGSIDFGVGREGLAVFMDINYSF